MTLAGLWGISGSLEYYGLPTTSTFGLVRPYQDLGGGKNVRSITPSLCSSGALKFSCSPLQAFFLASKTSWKLFRSENPALLGQSFCKYYELGAYVNLEIKTMAFFPVGNAAILYKQFNTSQCISCV